MPVDELQDLELDSPEATEGETEEPEVDPLDLFKGNIELQNAVKDACSHFIGLDKWCRRQEVIEARRQRFYWRNDQYIYWKSDAVGFVPAVAGQTVNVGNDQVSVGRYIDVYNIYTPYGESLLSTLIQNPPGVNWQPVNQNKPKDVTASDVAEKFQQKIEKDNDRKGLQVDVSRLFYTDGRTILQVRRTKDGCNKITAHGVLETKVVPITSACQEDLVSVTIAEELDIYTAKAEYPDYKDKITEKLAGLGESAYERIARLGVMQGTRLLMQAGDAFSHMITRQTCYLRPSAYEKIDEKFRDQVAELAPDGLKAIFCGDQYCGAENMDMDDALTVGFPTPGDGMSRPSLGKRVVPLQDVFNDEINLWHEAHDYCVPTLFMYSETGDTSAINEQISQPGNIVPFTSLPPGASSAESAFYAAVLEGVPQTLPNFISFVQGPLAQFISGAFPALFGGDTGDNDTAKGIAIQRDQAMGRMGLPWVSLQRLFAGAYTNAVKFEVKYGSDDEKFVYSFADKTGKLIPQEISISDLKGGSCVCVADTDASFPESTNSKRAAFQTLMAAAERNPIIAKVMADPNNQEYGHEVIGLPELVVPGAQSRNKQLIEISQLLKEPPTPPSDQELQMAVAQNPQLAQALTQWQEQKNIPGNENLQSPIPEELYHSSIPIDPIFDNNEEEFLTVQDWLNSEDRRREEEQNNNKQGVLNVRLHGIEHKNAIPPPPPPVPVKSGKPGPQAAAQVIGAAPTAQ